MAATGDDISKDQSALKEIVEQEERELLTSSGTAIDKHIQVEKKVETLTGEPHETVKTSSQVEIENESIAYNLEQVEGEQFSKSPFLDEVAGEKNSSSSQVQNGKEAEIKGAYAPGTQPNTEESRDLNTDDAICVVQEDNILESQVETSPNLAENVSTGIGSEPDKCKMIEGSFEDQTILLHSAIVEEETTGEVKSLSEHTIIVSIGTECCSDPSKVSKENTQDAEKLSHSVNVQDEYTEKAGNLPDFAVNMSIDIEDKSDYNAATKEETSNDVEMNTLGSEPGKISGEVKSIDDGKEKEIFELERSEIGSGTDTVSSSRREVLLKDVGPEKVREIERHSGTVFEKEEGETEDNSCTEPTPVNEDSDMVPIAAEENQAEIEKQSVFEEDVATEHNTQSVMSTAKEIPESSSNDLVIEDRETSGKESQEQVHVEPLAGEGIHDEVSKGLTEINIKVEEPVKPQISNTQKDLEALFPENDPGKENHNEFMQEASGPLQKIDSSQHLDRTNYAQVQRSTELLDGDLCEEKDSTSRASKSRVDNRIKENTTGDGSSKEIHNVVPDETAQKTYETEENDSEEGQPQPKDAQITATAVYKDFCKDEEKEMHIINKDEVKKEYLIEVSVEDKNKFDHEVRTEEINREADEIHEGEAVYKSDAEDIKENDSMERELELNKDQISVEQVDKDTSEKDDKKETQVIDEEEVDTAWIESSFKEEKQSNHEVTPEITNPKADEVHKEKVNHVNDNKENEGNSEAAPEPKEYQIAAEEDSTFNKDEEETKKIIHEQEMATKSLTESSITEPINPEAVHKQEAFLSNIDDKMKGHIEERAADITTFPIQLEQATNQGDDDEKIIGNDPKEIEAELKVDQIAAEKVMQAPKDKICEDAEETQIIEEQDVATEYLVDSCAEDFDKSDDKATNEETEDVSNREAVYRNDNKKAKGIDTEKAESEQKYLILAEEACKDEEVDAQIIEKREVAIEYSVEPVDVEENMSSHMEKIEVTSLEFDDLHEGNTDHPNDGKATQANDPEKVATELLNEDHQAEKEAYEDISSKDVEKITQKIDREKETNSEVSDIHYGAENIDQVEETTQHELQEPVSEDIIVDKIMTWVPNLEKIKEEFQPEHDFATSSAEEMKAEDSCEKSQKAEPEREGTHQNHDIEKQIDKETDSSNDCHSKSLEKEIIQESFQGDETKDADIESITNNDGLTHSAQERETDIMQEGNTEVLAEGFPSGEYKEKANFVTLLENPEQSKEEVLDNKVPLEIKLFEGSLTREECDSMEPQMETRKLDTVGLTENEEATLIAQEHGKGNPDATSSPTLKDKMPLSENEKIAENSSPVSDISEDTDKIMLDATEVAEARPLEETLKQEEPTLKDKIPIRENEKIVENSSTVSDISGETNKIMLDATEVAEDRPLEETLMKQEECVIMEQEKETRALHLGCITQEDDPNHTVETSSRMTVTSEEWNEKTLDTTEFAETRSVEGTLEQEDKAVMEQKKETKHLYIGVTTQNDDASHSTEEGEELMLKHEKSINVAATSKLAEELLPKEYQEQLENSSEVPEISMQSREADAVEEEAIRSVERNIKQDEWDALEPEGDEKETDMKNVMHGANVDAARDMEDSTILTEALPPSENQEWAENLNPVPQISAQRKENILDLNESIEIKLVEENLKQEDWDVMRLEKKEKNSDRGDTTQNGTTLTVKESEKDIIKQEGHPNVDAARDPKDSIVLTEALPPSEYQEWVENSNPVPQISKQRKENILNLNESIKIKLVEENLKQEDWDVRGLEKEEKNLDTDNTVQSDEATLLVKETEKDTIKQEGHPDDTCTNMIGEELSARKNQELAETPSAVPDIFNQGNEKMLDTKELTELSPVEETLKQEEQVVMEEEKDARYLHEERTTKNREAFNTAQEGQKDTVKCERNLDAAETRGLTEGLAAREFQELAETSIEVPNIQEEINKIILDSIGTKEIKLVAGISKETEWDSMEPEKETRDLVGKDTIKKDEVSLTAKQGEGHIVGHVRNPDASGTEELPPREDNEELAEHSSVMVSKASEKDEATISAKASQKDTIETEGNPDNAGTTGLTEELSTRDSEELAGNSIVLPDISKERNEKLLETREPLEISSIEEILKQKEWEVKDQEKEINALRKEVRIKNDEAVHCAQAGENVVRNKENENAADENRIGEELIPQKQHELAENSSEDKITEITEPAEIIQVDIMKLEEWCVIEPAKKISNLDTESTKQNDAMLSTQDREKEKLLGHPDAHGTGMLIEGLAQRECQELPENYITMLKIPENGKEKILESEIIQGEEGLKQEERHVMQEEKEIKDLDKGTTLECTATITAQEAGGNYVGISDSALAERLTEGLLPREYQEHAQKSCIVPNISEEKKEVTLKTTESLEIKPVQGSFKQGERDATEPDEAMGDLESEATLWNHEAMHSEYQSKMKTDRQKGHPDAAGIDKLTEGLPAREYQELVKNSSTGEERDAIEPEKETKALDSTAQKDVTTLLVGEGERETVKHEGNQDAAYNNRLTEEFPPEELAENSSLVTETSEARDEKLVDAIGSTVINPIEGISKQDEWNIKEPEKEGVENMEIKHQGNANSAGMDGLAEEFPRSDLVKNFTAEHVSEEENEKMIDIPESKVKISVEGSIKSNEWDALELEKKIKDVDLDDRIMDKEATNLAQKSAKVTGENEGDTVGSVRASEALSQTEFKELAKTFSATPETSDKSKEKMVDNMEPTEKAVIEEAKEIQVQDHLQPDNSPPTPEEVDQEDVQKSEVQPRSMTVDSESGNTITEVKALNATDKCAKVLLTETDNQRNAPGDTDTKDRDVNSSSASTASVVDVTPGKSPEQLTESVVSEDKQVHAVNEINEDATNSDTNTLSLSVHDTRGSPHESTCNIQKKHEVVNLEEEEDSTEKASILSSGTSEHEQIINATGKTEQNHHTLETASTQELKAKAQGSSSRDEQKQQLLIDTVRGGFNPQPSEVKPEEAAPSHLASMPRDASSSLHDLLQASKKDIYCVTDEFLPESHARDVETEKAHKEEMVTHEEGEGDDADKRKESAYDSPVTVEAPSDTDVKTAAQKKPHNILSGVGSKVKQSIKKVKKAITGKSSHPKSPSPK